MPFYKTGSPDEELSMRFFNTAGPIKADGHYHIPPLECLDLAGVLTLIHQKKYLAETEITSE